MGRAHVLIGRDPSKAVLPILFWTAGADKSRWFVLTLLSLLGLPHQPYFTWKKELNLGPFSEFKIYILRGYCTHDMNNVQSLFDILQWLSCTYIYMCVCISDTYLKCLYTDTLTQLGPCVLDDWSEHNYILGSDFHVSNKMYTCIPRNILMKSPTSWNPRLAAFESTTRNRGEPRNGNFHTWKYPKNHAS